MELIKVICFVVIIWPNPSLPSDSKIELKNVTFNSTEECKTYGQLLFNTKPDNLIYQCVSVYRDGTVDTTR